MRWHGVKQEGVISSDGEEGIITYGDDVSWARGVECSAEGTGDGERAPVPEHSRETDEKRKESVTSPLGHVYLPFGKVVG